MFFRGRLQSRFGRLISKLARPVGARRMYMLALTSSLLLAAQPVWAGHKATADKTSTGAAGRQIASVTGISRAAADASSRAAKAVQNSPAVAASGNFLARTQKAMPASVQDAADKGCKAARECMHLTAANLDKFGQWLVKLDRQLNAPPIATPMGAPYISKSSRHIRLMPDGRLKTVVQQ